MADFDIFFDAADRTSTSQTRTEANISGAQAQNAEGANFLLTGAPTTPFAEGMRVFVWDNAGGFSFGTVKKVPDTTHVTVLPLQSAADTVTALPYLFPTGATIRVVEESAAHQIIDLSEAPDDAYDFLVVGCSSVESTGAPANVDTFMRLGALQDDPLSGVTSYGLSSMALNGGNPDRANFVAASKVSLLGGQRYENFIGFNGFNTLGLIATLSNPRLLALRVTGGFFAGDGKTVEQTTASTSYVDVTSGDLGPNLPAGDYLIVATWCASQSSTSNRWDIVLEQTAGGIVLANHVGKPNVAGDYPSAGFYGVVTLGGTNRVRLRIKATATTAKIKNVFLCAIPIANVPALAAAQASQDLSTNFSQSVTTNGAVTAATSASVTLQSGRHIEIIAGSFGGDNPIKTRPTYEVASLVGTLGNHNMIFGATSVDYQPTFWFIRNRRAPGATQNSITMARSTAVTTLLRARDFTFSWLREQPDFVALPYEPIAVIADVEMGGQVLKAWNSTTTTRRYAHRMEGARAYSRVRVNSQEYTHVYALSDVADGTWFWDPSTLDLYVQLTTTHAAIGTGAPSDSGINIVVVPLLLVGRQSERTLVDFRANRWNYRPLINAVPKSTQELKSDNARFGATGSLGSLQIAAAHGEFDDTIFQASFNSYRVKIRRGFLRRSNRIDDLEVIANSTIRKITSDFKAVSLQLLDRRRIMQTPVSTTTITVKESYGANARSRDDQEVSPVWGPTLGLKAYRIQANEAGGATYNIYQFAPHGVKGVSAVYLDSARSKRVTADTSSTYTNAGQIRMLNSQLGAAPLDTQPPDVIYVDLVAGRTSNGLSTGVAIQTPGAIARDLLVAYGLTPATRLIEPTLRMLDRRLRWQQIAGGGGRRPAAPVISFVVSGKTTVEEALTELCGETVAYWLVNHQDRVGVDVPDFDRGNLARNGDFEADSVTAYPWRTINGGTIALTTARKYAGARSAEISNGAGDPAAGAAESIVLAAGGTHVLTMEASLLDGVPDAFTLGMVGPSGVETLSEPQTVGTGRWSRHSLVYDSEPGDAGFTEIRIYPAFGSAAPTRVAVDRIEVYRVACVTERHNSTPIGVDFEDEAYVECDTPYAVNREDPEHASKRRIGESEARGLSAAIEPEGKFAVPSSKRAELTDTHAADGESAGGLGAPITLYYSRPRPVLTIDVDNLERIPLVGEYVYHRNNPRIPESTDEYPIWRISKVETDDNTANVVRLEIKRQLDPVIDRPDISPDTVPMGGIALARATSAITDFTDVAAMADQHALGHTKPDSTTQRGDLSHVHPLMHLHGVALHQHNVTPASHALDKALAPFPAEYVGKFHYPGGAITGTPTPSTRGKTDGGHAHGVPGSALAVAAASGTSSAPNTTLQASPGPVEPSARRVRFVQRTAAATTTIDPNLIVGLRTSAIPAGWKRVVELNDWFLRGATTNGPLSTTTTSTFVPSDSGSTLALTSGTGAVLGRRLTVTKSGSTVHVVITVAAGANPTVVPLHESSDVANGSFPSGSAATVTADSQVIIRTNVATSTYVPNDAGSTLIVASGTGIAIGSLLSVVNTADSDKLVHVRVSAGSGTSWTVVPLHLAGDQANAYSPGFPAGTTTKVIDSEFIAPTHKHGGLIPSHQHAAGGHAHAQGAADFYLGFANQTIQAQRFDFFSDSLGTAAPQDHIHRVKVPLPAEGGNSGSAAGTLTGDLVPMPAYYELVFIQPVDAFQTTLPAGAVLFWLQSDTPPQGYTVLGAAKNLLIKGAAAGVEPGSGAGGHVHQQSNTAHTMAHAHGGGTVIVDSDSSDTIGALIAENNTATTAAVAAGSDHVTLGVYYGGHGHAVTAGVSSTDPGLTISANDTGAPDTALPWCRRIMLIQKS